MHHIHSKLLQEKVHISLVGAGGSGSLLLTLLARMHIALLHLGHPGGLHVNVWEPDQVSRANIGRQLFYESDIGLNKGKVLVHRLNIAYGLNWTATPIAFDAKSACRDDVVIGCVDTVSARVDIGSWCIKAGVKYWLDLGNRAMDGQCILGQPCPQSQKDWYLRLPTVLELFPNLLTGSDNDDHGPSCSLAEALHKQDLFVNQILVSQAMNLLWRLFRYGEIDYSGVFVNLRTGHVSPLPIDPKHWKRFGFKGARRPRESKENKH